MWLGNKGHRGNDHHTAKKKIRANSGSSHDRGDGDNKISSGDVLPNTNSSTVDEIEQLKAKFYESDIEREGLKSLAESLKIKVGQLQQQIWMHDNSSQENLVLRSQKELLDEQIEELQRKSREYEKLIRQLRVESESVRQQNTEFSRDKVELEKKNRLLDSELRRLQIKVNESDKEVNDWRYEVDRLSDRVNASEKNVAEVKFSHEALDAEYRRLQYRNAESELEIETLQSEVKRLKDMYVTMRQESDEVTNSHDALKVEMKALRHVVVEQDRIMRIKNQGADDHMHPAYCNICNKFIVGIRYKCGHCGDYDICANCESSNHDRTHVFIKIKCPIDNDRFTQTSLLPEFRLIEQDENDVDHKTTCSVCHKNIRGIRHKCGHCAEFEMCVNCEAYPYNIHDPTHVFIKIKRPVYIDSKKPLLPPGFRPSIEQ